MVRSNVSAGATSAKGVCSGQYGGIIAVSDFASITVVLKQALRTVRSSLISQRLPCMSRWRLPELLTEAGDLYPHSLQEAGKLGGGFELGYRVELLERRREGVREAPQCARFEL
jgi:hypothetical protein